MVKRVGIVLPSWNPNEPRFIVKDSNPRIADNRGFKNGKCVFNQRLGFAYSVEEIVEILNDDEYDKLREENKQLQQQMKHLNAFLVEKGLETEFVRRYDE